MATTIIPGVPSSSRYRWARLTATPVPELRLPDSKPLVDRNPRSECARAFFENSKEILFIVSYDADGIWGIDDSNQAFSEVFHAVDDDNEQFKALPAAFTTRLKKALRQCTANDRAALFDMPLRIESHVRCWEFVLEPWSEFDRPQRQILGRGHEVTDQRQTIRDLKRVTRKLLKAQDDERRRIARDLHDSTAQHLVALGIGITHLQIVVRQAGSLNSATARRLIDDMRTTLSQAHDEIRTLSLLLHPPELDGAHIADALRRFVAGFARRTGIRARLIVDDGLSCRSADTATILMRIAQEALINVYRHANATEVTVELRAADDALVLKIIDNGKGLGSYGTATGSDDVEMIGVGIPGMRARVNQVKGELSVEDGRSGVQVMVVIPQGSTRSGRRTAPTTTAGSTCSASRT